MAAGASDPLEEMLLFSEEVDEKAVSDLVGSLESQLAGGRGSAEGPPTNSSPPSHQQQEHQETLVEGGSPVRQQQGHPAPPHFAGAEEAARCPSAVSSPTPAPGTPPALSPPPAAAGRGASVNSSSMQQSHGAAPRSITPSPPAAPVLLQAAAPPPPTGALAQPVNNHVDVKATAPAAGSGAREVESPRSGCSPPAAAAGAVNSVLPLNSEAATAGGSPEAAGAVTPAATASRELAKAVQLGCTAAAASPPPAALSLLQRPALHTVPPAAHSANGTSSSAPVVVTQSLKAGCAPAAITQVVNHQNPSVSHSKPESSTAQTKLLTHNPAVNALSNSTSSVPTMNLVTHPAQSSVANSAPVASSTITLNAISKPTVNIIGAPGSAVGVTKSATAVPVLSAVPQLLSPRPAVGTAQRIVAPQLIVRPPQQTTIQLPPGFTIPPGMVLVRTEAGQLVMVPQQVLAQAQVQAQVQTQGQGPASISSRLPVPTSGPVFRLTATQQPTSVAASPVHLGLPLQAKIVQSTATSVSATSTATLPGVSTLSHTTVSVATTSAQSLIKTTVATGTQATQQPTVIFGGQTQTPAQPQGQPRLPPPPHTTAQVPAQPQVIPSSPVPGTTVVSQKMQENVKKCKNFLATLIKLASHNSPSPETSRNVKDLVQDLLDAKIDPEEFTGCLQSELKSSPQPYLVPFLKKSLPALRQSLLNSQHSVLQGQPSQQPLQQTKLSQVIPQPASGSICSSVTTQTVGIRQPNSICTFVSNTVQPPHVKLVQSNQSSQLIIQSTTAQTVKRNPACQTTQIRMPVVITQSIRPQGTVGKAPRIQASPSPGGFGVQVSANQKMKLNDPGGGSFRDDDDINDVASMAGVNLNEESARIMATNSDLVGTQIQSCKDEPFLAAIPLHKRILEMAKKLGMTDVPTEVVTFISHATQNRLRTVIEKVTMVTQHRMESQKNDEWYEQATDVRSQLKFFEQLERLEKQRKDEQEREILLKAAKSRSRQEDPEQARLKQKAKEMQQQELAQMRQRDANLTALAAIGPWKKRKLDSPGLLTIGGEALGMTSGGQAGFGAPSSRQYTRQKITRVNLRDFIFYMEQERETSHSLLLYRALLK
ncbi:transcription initiation factor TFIID subunit 4-like isoform X2 [Dermochelys coriacea]|uniref:transcription initiation factor TFIID subunit 4-like isoform X2 n=1 Tax=Dermochelys coriacea TaxID=27794 RepID=UPI0018E89875|nr:transcription initiation factor TFIID subunit 4-like isoform X2 [Dermochelys coriacea]